MCQTEVVNILFNLVLIKLKLNSSVWQVDTILDSMALENNESLVVHV